MNSNNDDDNNEALRERQEKANKNYDTVISYNSIPVRSIIVVLQKNRRPWTQGAIIYKGDHKHNHQ